MLIRQFKTYLPYFQRESLEILTEAGAMQPTFNECRYALEMLRKDDFMGSHVGTT